jgi:NTP pyrophosphatase (non-canonical NTP hydrolase)
MKTDLETLISQVEQWANARGLITNGNELAQCVKTTEELGELASALLKKDNPKIIDSIGDVTVCLIILSKQLGLKFGECLQSAYNEIENRKGKTVNGIFEKE